MALLRSRSSNRISMITRAYGSTSISSRLLRKTPLLRAVSPLQASQVLSLAVPPRN